MKKSISLRAHLTQWVPDLAKNPDKLHVYIEKGRIATRYGSSLAFEYHYTLQLVITDFAESPDVLIVPILVWVLEHQPNLLFDEKLKNNLLNLEAEMIGNDTIDLALTLELSERVLVKAVAGGYECEHIGEPPLPDLGGPLGWDIYLKGVLLT